MKDSDKSAYAQGFAAAMSEGGVYVPATLLRHYRKAGLSDSEAMLLLQLMLFRQAEGNDFPTLEQLGERLDTDAQATAMLVQRLMKEGYLTIEESFDPMSGVQSESYNWQGWIARTAALSSREAAGAGSRSDAVSAAGAVRKPDMAVPAAAPQQNIFSVFEQEFGRPLSPMEFETISGWLDEYRYPEELIRFALKESVFAGKLHFNYIDRILLEWSRNRVTNVDEARARTQHFRGGKQ